jgi:hypothetical protein
MATVLPADDRRRLADLRWPALVCAATSLLMVVPLLFSRTFFMRGDSAAQFAPTWYKLGQEVRSGNWPVGLDPDAWAGGNYAAEALFGIYNPINAVFWVVVSLVPNLIIGVWLVKTAVMVALALGTYLLAREYGAAPWSAAVVGVALPVSGFTLYWDGGSWAAGLIAFAYTPWVWLTFRRVLRGTLNPLWGFLVGALAVTQGNPYGTLGVVIVGVGLIVEALALRQYAGLRRLVLLGGCVAALLPLVYLPLLSTADLAVRSTGPLFSNSGKLRPALGDLLFLSSPTFVPEIRGITGPMRVPATYAAWFVLPLLPWLHWSVLRGRARQLAGVAVVTLAYAALALGPAELWLFRWPLRLVEYTYLGLGVGFAVVLGHGLRRDHSARRTALTAGLLAFFAFLTWAEDPRWHAAAFGGTALLVVLTAVLLAWHRWGPAVPAALAAICVGGSGLVLTAQMQVFGENASSRVWHFPADVSELRADFDHLDGRVLQFADLKRLQAPGRDRRLRAAWDHYLAGTMYSVAGVDAVNNYTGMGFLPFTRTLCMEYDGLTKACGFRNAWRSSQPGRPPLVELMKVDTVVAEPRLTAGVVLPDGWEEEVGNEVVTIRRTTEQPWPESRLSWVPETVEVTDARTRDLTERVTVADTGSGGTAVFATLGWPGYSATFDGEPVEVGYGPTGLLTAELPPDSAGDLVVSYRQPGLTVGIVAALLGALGAVALGVLHRRRHRFARG